MHVIFFTIVLDMGSSSHADLMPVHVHGKYSLMNMH